MGSFDKCDGYVALVRTQDKAVVATTIRIGTVRSRALNDLRRRVESSNFRTKVLDFDMVDDGGLIYIFAVVDAVIHTAEFIERVLNEFIGFVRRSGVINDPIVSHIMVPVRQPRLT